MPDDRTEMHVLASDKTPDSLGEDFKWETNRFYKKPQSLYLERRR